MSTEHTPQSAETTRLRSALDYLVSMANGHDYADATKIADAEWLIEDALLRPRVSGDDA